MGKLLDGGIKTRKRERERERESRSLEQRSNAPLRCVQSQAPISTACLLLGGANDDGLNDEILQSVASKRVLPGAARVSRSRIGLPMSLLECCLS